MRNFPIILYSITSGMWLTRFMTEGFQFFHGVLSLLFLICAVIYSLNVDKNE